MVKLRSASLTVRLVLATLVAAAAVAVLVALLLSSISSLRSTSRAATRSEQAIVALDRVEENALDMETGVRGYVITGRRTFLAPYVRAAPLVDKDGAELDARLSDEPQMALRARAVNREVSDFSGVYAPNVIALVHSNPSEARSVSVTEQGKVLFDAIRADAEGLRGALGARQASRAHGAQTSAHRATTAGVVVLVLLLALIVGLALAVHRIVVMPLRGVLRRVDALEHGDLSAQLPETGAAEIGRLGRAINRLSESLRDSRAEVEQRNIDLAQIAQRNLVLLDSVFTQAPVGLAFLDAELRYVRVNDALAQINGRPAADHIGKRVGEQAPDLAAELVAQLHAVTAEHGQLRQHEIVRAGPPAQAWVIDAHAVHQGKRVVGASLVVVDVSDRHRAAAEEQELLAAERRARAQSERAQRRSSFLAEASALLDASMNYEETLAAFARLAVPDLADWCMIDLIDDDGSLRNVATAHVDPERVAAAQLAWRRNYIASNVSIGAAQVVRTGRTECYETIDEAMLGAIAMDDEQLAALRELELTSAMVVPMIARGHILGAITFLAGGGERHFELEDLGEARELGRRAALAVDTARLYHQREETATVLQTSLLPHALPDVPGFSLAARFHPAGDGTLVGGDFYDVFATGPDSWALVVGDVCGKGAQAAAVTALARYTLRAFAADALSPSQALGRLNEAMLRQIDDGRFLTIVYAVLDLAEPRRPTLTVACAGHPAPILVPAAGEPRPIPAHGRLLGVVAPVRLEVAGVTLSPGDAVAMFSDGVTDARRPVVDSAADIGARLPPTSSADGLANALERGALPVGSAVGDDVAILVARFDG